MKQEEFEKIVMNKLLSGDHHDLVTLREQYARAAVVDRDWIGNGVITHFTVPGAAPLANVREFGLADVFMVLADSAAPAHAHIFVRNGRIDRLECYRRDWPRNPEIVSINYSKRDGRDSAYLQHQFSKYEEELLRPHLIATGSHGAYQWLTTGHDMVQFLNLCPPVVIGRYLAVTALDGDVLRLNENEKNAGWESRRFPRITSDSISADRLMGSKGKASLMRPFSIRSLPNALKEAHAGITFPGER